MKLKPFYLIDPKEWLLTRNADVAFAQRRALEDPALSNSTLEEYVRQWVLRELIDSYKYPQEWLGERIVVEETVQMATMEKQADISIKNDRGRTFLYVETKASNITDGDFHKAERQLEGYLSSTHTAMVGMVTDGSPGRTRCIVKKIDPNDFDYIPDLPEYLATGLRQKTRLVLELPKRADAERETGLQKITGKYESILFDCHSAIRDIDGLHDDECLDELCKIIYAKIYDERMTLQESEGTAFRFQIYGGNTEEIASNVRDLYEEARTKDLEIFAQRIPNYERSRGVFKNQIRLSSGALVRVVELLQNYSLVDTPTDIKGRAFQKVLGPAIRAGMGQYFTPDPIARLAVGLAKPTPKDLILDPFCGSGHFLTTALEYVRRNYSGKIPERDLFEFSFFHLHGIEKSDRMVRIAMTDMLLQNDGHSNIRNTDALLSFDNYPDIKALGGEGNESPEIFDVIITNPPFGSLLKEETASYLGRFELGARKKSLPLEIFGLERCFQLLKPGGRLLIILPDGVLSTSQLKFVRDWYRSQAYLVGVFSLPQLTFVPYGAGTKTSLVLFRKFNNGEELKPYEVFYCKIENIGFDTTGRPIGGSEIDTAINSFWDSGGWI
jgi:type I restriction enzyme M protein